MKIDLNTNYSIFRKTGGQQPAKTASVQTDRSSKTDVVDFSRGQTTAPGKELTNLRSNLLRDVSAPAGADQLASLKDRIREGSYHPSTDEIVNAILGE